MVPRLPFGDVPLVVLIAAFVLVLACAALTNKLGCSSSTSCSKCTRRCFDCISIHWLYRGTLVLLLVLAAYIAVLAALRLQL